MGDLVTVLPAGDSTYLVIDFLRDADTEEAQDYLGPLWLLYDVNAGRRKMHEKWIKVINA